MEEKQRSLKFHDRDDAARHLLFASLLVWSLTCLLLHPCDAASGSANNEQTGASSQPLWSYQVKPGQVNSGNLFSEAFGGLSQRQGALTTGPLMTILPILLIAAGGILLLLPFLTMMFASPFGGPGGAGGLYGYNNGGQFGYPQAAAALRAVAAAGATAKKRSLNSPPSLDQPRVWQELLDHVSTTIDELSKKYSPSIIAMQTGQHASNSNKRSMSSTLRNSNVASESTTANDPATQTPSATNNQQQASNNNSQQ